MRQIAYGFLYKRGGFGGNHCDYDMCTNNKISKDPIRLLTGESGFLYGDALIAVTLVLFILPTILCILSNTLSMVHTSYIDDYTLQDTVACIEAGKSMYDSGEMPTTGNISSLNGHNLSNITFKQSATEEVVNGVSILRFSVQAVDNGVTIYELSTFLGPSHH